MERACATDCSAQTNSFYDNSNPQGVRKTVVNVCCQSDYCNNSAHLISNKFQILFFLAFYLFKMK